MSKTKKTKKTERQITQELEELDKLFLGEYCRFSIMIRDYLNSFFSKRPHRREVISDIADHAGIVLAIAHILKEVLNKQGE